MQANAIFLKCMQMVLKFNQGDYMLKMIECPMCGKYFYPRAGWKYTVKFEARKIKVCSYSCSSLKQAIRDDKEKRKEIEKDYIYK